MSNFSLKKHVLVTGANGFIGHHLTPYLCERGFSVRAAVRQDVKVNGNHIVAVGNVNSQTNWLRALDGIDCVVHLAGRVHVMQEYVQDSLAAFRAVNVDGTLNLARQAAAAGVKRLTENLQVDCSESMRLLNWQPPVSLKQGIKRSVV